MVAQQPGTSGKTAAGDRTFILPDRDGKPFDGVVASIGGASLPIQQGVLTVPGDVLARAGAAGTLRLYVPGYVPKQIQLSQGGSGLTLTPLQPMLALDLGSAAGHVVRSADGTLDVEIPPGMATPANMRVEVGGFFDEAGGEVESSGTLASDEALAELRRKLTGGDAEAEAADAAEDSSAE